MRKCLGVLVAVAMLVTACDGVTIDGPFGGERIDGSGDVAMEARVVSGFSHVVVMGSGLVELNVTGNESLEIEAEDNIIPHLTTEVVNGRLELSTERDVSLRTTRPIVYRITAESMDGVTILGSGDVDVTDISSNGFEVEINGSGDVALQGEAEELEVRINGSGDFKGEDLVAAVGSVNVAGSGNALVNVLDDLTVTIAGSGDVRYMGSPVLHESIAGSGSVSPR